MAPHLGKVANRFPYLDVSMDFPFPDPEQADRHGIIAVGGNLSPGMLLSAYRRGIFPWYSVGEPILWWNPDPRFILFPSRLHVGTSMRKVLRQSRFRLTADREFHGVIEACSEVPRPGQDGTWIGADMITAYVRLHELGFAHSVEAWDGETLAGGLYGVSLGSCFFGESMFTRVTDASKTAFVALVRVLERRGFTLVDCQVHTGHLDRFGAVHVPRARFLELLGGGLTEPTRRGSWSDLENDLNGVEG
jgi:leucyl/phenylalanyl-tRNA---protein transferase